MTYMPLDLRPPPMAACRDRRSADALDIDAARQLILADVVALGGSEPILVGRAVGRIAADPIISPVALPRFDNSAMDGYALSGADLAAVRALAIIGRVQAGQANLPVVRPGTVARVTTGAAIPPGTAAVVPDEDVDVLPGGAIRLRRSAGAGANIRWRGEDTGCSDVLIREGTRIDVRHVAIMLSAGVSVIDVRRRPKVALLSVGNELVEPEDEVGLGKIVDANRILLREMLAASGAEIVDLGIAEDSVSTVAQRLETLAGIDVLITTGGIAGSECDVTAKGVEATGGEVRNLHLDLKPGRSIAFGRLDRIRTLHLPGNPIAALVSAHLFAMPMLNRLAGRHSPEWTVLATAGDTLKHRRGRTEFVLARVIGQAADGHPIVFHAGKAGSANLQPLCGADGFVEISATVGDISPGQAVGFHPFGRVFG